MSPDQLGGWIGGMLGGVLGLAGGIILGNRRQQQIRREEDL